MRQKIVYVIECNKKQKGSLANRLSEHRGYIKSMFPTKATGIHLIQVKKTTRKKGEKHH